MTDFIVRNMHIFAAGCSGRPGFFGFPRWYSYLQLQTNPLTGTCNIVRFQVPGDFLLVGLAILDIALHIVGIVAVGFVIYGGVQYVISNGEPEKTAKAQQTIIDALVGLAIAFISVSLVSFLGSKLK